LTWLCLGSLSVSEGTLAVWAPLGVAIPSVASLGAVMAFDLVHSGRLLGVVSLTTAALMVGVAAALVAQGAAVAFGAISGISSQSPVADRHAERSQIRDRVVARSA
jgi:hypothetical protein